jgi:hypothetical protein
MAELNNVAGAVTALADELRQLLATPETITVIRDVMPNEPVIFPNLFPIQSTTDFTATYFKQQSGDDVAQAQIMSFDSETPLNILPGIEQEFINLAKVGSKIPWKESDIATYRTISAEKRRELLLDYDSVALRLSTAIRERQEVMAIDAISLGRVRVNDVNLKKDVDYKVPDIQKPVLSGTDVWEDPSSDPLEDIDEFIDILRREGRTRPTRAITSRRVWKALRNHPRIKTALNPIGTSTFYVTDAALRAWLSENGLPEMTIYDRSSTVLLPGPNGEGVETKSYKPFPEDVIVFLPSGPLGNMLEGPTVEASLSTMSGIGEVGTPGLWYDFIVDPYNDPPRVFQKVVAVTFPTFPLSKQILIAKVV